MHAVVSIKQVPDTAEVRIDPRTNTMIRTGVPSIVNPDDRHAIEEAVYFKEQFGGRVSVVTMGPNQAKDALREAVSYGADQGILLSDRRFAGADTLATSYVLWKSIVRLNSEAPVELVLCGRQALDGDTGQVPPGIATRLGWPARLPDHRQQGLGTGSSTARGHGMDRRIRPRSGRRAADSSLD